MNTDSLALSAGPLLLRPWRPDDAPALLAAHEDPVMRHRLATVVRDAGEAERWLLVQREGWESGGRFGFAVTDPAADGALVGHVVLKGLVPGTGSAEVGYWTTAAARGRGVASRALEALTGWAFAEFAGSAGLRRLELFHRAGNEGSCRVAERCGYPLAEIVAPPRPAPGHRHVRHASPGASDR
ncbi:N-acetyltransferase [Streptomyces nitrosporeus]|uniref:N-acetyltransferase n=1 Tax=Streptomyces nitrosporeus TaxID=28894 RepID=A0A5J6FH21_9ACTN|nr:GNAT family N-acetyltransferase [Streptomyces nitrosporeus]QEU74225.1 N-acetyltransferase [Streptomyces nitrosporeus]GGY97158.1 hypothetical protein GCM10010327_29850 [Streptomyces nitrosporeus]